MEDDAQKRHTDCIYFLASPLTCKKGKNCDYRHSEAARINPRDCRFWKLGNCLNAHCPFRHLPLEVNKQGPAISTGTTMHLSVPAKAMAAVTAGLTKSKTSCYFFSQGNCAKGDKCAFMHGVHVASSAAEAPANQNSANGMKDKADHTTCRPVNTLQSGVISQEVCPTTIKNSEARVEAYPFPSRALTSVPGALEKVAVSACFRQHGKEPEKLGREPDRMCAFPDLVSGSIQLKAIKKALQVQDNGQGPNKSGDFALKNGFSSKASWKDVPSASGLHQSPVVRKEGHSLLADSRKGSQRLYKAPAMMGSESGCGDCKGQKEQSEAKLCRQLTKRMKAEGSIYPSTGEGEYSGLASEYCGGRKRHDDLPSQKRQRQGRNNRNAVMEEGSDAVKRVKLSKEASPYLPPLKAFTNQSLNKVPSKGKQPLVVDPKAAIISDIRSRMPSNLTFKSSAPEKVKETLNFAGPKSLAQIKAEKLAVRESLKPTGSLQLSSMMSEPASDIGNRTAAKSSDAGPSKHNLCRVSLSSIKRDNGLMLHEAANSEGSKSLIINSEGSERQISSPWSENQINVMPKRMREEELGTDKTEAMRGLPVLAEAPTLSSFGRFEDGESCGDDDESNEDDDGLDDSDDCTLVSSEKDSEAMSPLRSQSSSEEAQEDALAFEADSSEDGSKLDLEMEESMFTVEDYDIDDEDDFAKKLSRFFGLASNV